ncbi:aldo/keto reductase [Streptomyces sp. NPDC048172]|uniref:aldo/keto reductase n=1 Tax=Streptomyces sp. NPDC048172 TaxID=3365505 RepID=UPI00371B3590
MSLRTHKVGRLSVSSLCLGGNVFGWTADAPTSFAVLDAYVEAGGNFLDTADTYASWVDGLQGGESETVIGDWLAARGNRDRVVLATKAGGHPEFRGLAPDTLRAAVDASLGRLRTDYIDLFYTHFDDESVPVEDIVGTLDELVRAGKIREIAASNISPERLRASLAASDAEGLARYVALQPHYNLVSRDTYEGELPSLAERENLAVVPYYALAAGFLTGKYRPDEPVPESARSGGAAQHLESERGRRVLRELLAIAAERDAAPATVALAWLASRPTVTTPLASARTVAQLGPLLALDDVELTEEQWTRLTAASA